MTENKTQPTDRTVEGFLAAVEHPVRSEDGFELLDLIRQSCTSPDLGARHRKPPLPVTATGVFVQFRTA